MRTLQKLSVGTSSASRAMFYTHRAPARTSRGEGRFPARAAPFSFFGNFRGFSLPPDLEEQQRLVTNAQASTLLETLDDAVPHNTQFLDGVPDERPPDAFEGCALEVLLLVTWIAALAVSGTALVKYCMGPTTRAVASRVGTNTALPMGATMLRAMAATTGVAIKVATHATGAAFRVMGHFLRWILLSVAGSLLHLVGF